ncbi:molybdopterin molybdotransferase MoeA [Litoreibacter arenae]|uniref:Molybdopterin molybdenumtransferase n=1 Tax=Litoreibacter arenae DSM 19593 TaxID=1123360 RepID=S9RLK5_9RHOB|nr:gephyrin-like molybdotransferase Glp [Litoreibacter arenae]EPX79000.1 Molybdopterin biosynthesis protein MoeA [Litoreibacter arenae DSM 19593]
MISVSEALAAVLDLGAPVEVEHVPLDQADGRVLAQDVAATRDQPPFSASAMDGYAVATADVTEGDRFTVIGEAAAGHRFERTIGSGEAVRIFTGAPLPGGGVRVIIQEDVTREDDAITVGGKLGAGHHVRPAGGDFKAGDVLSAPRRLSPSDVALLASMNVPFVPVRRHPVVAIIATGDELVSAGGTPRDDQIIASNSLGLAAMFRRAGATARVLPIAKDTPSSLKMDLSLAEGADLLVTIGGASVGDHDIVAEVAESMGLERQFYKVAMRPGKPLMAGWIGGMAMIGLPGNPVSSMVCGEVFIRPLLDKYLGLPSGPRARIELPLTEPLEANSQREHYMRAVVENGTVRAFARQDSSLLTVLAQANALIVRPPGDPARNVGEPVQVIAL